MKTGLTLVLIAIAAQVAAADDVTGVVFVAQPVRAPVALDRVSPVAPFVPAGTAERAGEIVVGPDGAAALWLDELDVVRVRRVGGAGALKFARVVGAAGTHARLAERGIAIAPDITYLAQPPGGGDTWMIWADRAATIRVERPVARDGRMVWDDTQRDLLAWVDRGGTRPAIPIAEGAYVAALILDAEASIGAAIEAQDPALRTAVRAWRKAGVIAELTAIRPLIAPQLRVEPLDDLAGMTGTITVPDPEVPDPRPYHRVERGRTYELELAGPGALHVDARALLPSPRGGVSNAPELSDVAIAVTAGDRVLARRAGAAAYATAPDPTTPPPAFPTRQPLTSREGDTLGERIAVDVPLFPGRHRYRIALEGAPLAVRAAVGRRRVRIGEALGSDDVDEFLADARRAIATTSPPAELVRALIANRAGTPVTAKAPQLPPALRAAWLAATGDVRDRALVKRALADADRGTAWTLALVLARRAEPSAVRALFEAVPGAPPPSLIPDLVALLPRSTPLERVRNWPLGATLLAARARPIDPTVRAQARTRWRTGEWVQVPPALADRDAEPPAPQRWLVEATAQPLATPRAWRAGDLVRLEPGTPRTVTALPSLLDPARAALLDVFVATPEVASIEVTVDGKAFATLPLAAVERVQLAVPPGTHAVAIAGPRSLRGWVSHVPASPVEAADRARIHALWPVAGESGPLRYELPTGDLPIEVALRTFGPGPVRVALRGDVGAPTELVIAGGAPDAKAHALDRAHPDVSDELRFVVWPAPGAKTVWLETDAPARVVASIATRREHSVVTATPSPVPAVTDLLERVARASRTLATAPDDAAARASRASDLLDLGELGLAREDLVQLLKNRTAVPAEEQLFARLDSGAEPTHVALAVSQPVVVGPALAAVATPQALADHRAAAAALHAGHPEAALAQLADRTDPVALAIAARAHTARGDDLAAARALVRAYQATDRWPVALEALDLLAPAIADRRDAPPAGVIALTYGLAARVRTEIDHPRVRRALVVAAAQSGWDTLGAMATSAGHEMVLSTRPILPPAPAVLVREALVAPAWATRSAHTLTAGTAAVLDATLPANAGVRAQVHCIRVRSAELATTDATAPCALTARVDNGAARAFTAPLGATTDVPLPALAAGRHVVEIALTSETDAASVRFTTERAIPELTDPPGADGRHPIRIERRTKLFVASTTTPVTTTVQGPTTLWVQARAAGAARTADVTATPASGAAVHASLALPADRDADARGDGHDVALSPPTDAFLILPDATTYQIAVRPDRGELVARMALRDERRARPPRAPGPWYAAAPQVAPAFAVATTPTAPIDAPVYDGPAIGHAGTFAFDLAIAQDDRGEEDLTSTRIGGLVESGVTFRRALVPRRVWLSARGALRGREDSAAIAAGAAELTVEQLPLGTTIDVGGTAFTQDFSDGRAWHLRGRARVGWRWPVTDTVTARPWLGYAQSYLNTTPEIVALTTDKIDPDVYSTYRDTHRRDANAGAALLWMPFQDVVGYVQASATSNADLASLDHAGTGVGLRVLAPLPLLGDTLLAASYLPNYRFADDDRMTGTWRHDLDARVEWTLWTTTQGRFVLSLWDELYPGTRNAFGAALRFDLVRHRGLADFTPSDAPFASLVEHRAYAPLEAP